MAALTPARQRPEAAGEEMAGRAKPVDIESAKPTLMERAHELAKSGDYAYLYQIERTLIKEGYPAAKRFKVSERIKLKAILKFAKN